VNGDNVGKRADCIYGAGHCRTNGIINECKEKIIGGIPPIVKEQ